MAVDHRAFAPVGPALRTPTRRRNPHAGLGSIVGAPATTIDPNPARGGARPRASEAAGRKLLTPPTVASQETHRMSRDTSQQSPPGSDS